MTRKVYVIDKETGKLVEKPIAVPPPQATQILAGIDEFKSPIDQTRIGDRRQLLAHNRKHGVTDPRDYGPDWFKRKAKERQNSFMGNTPADKQDRIEALKRGFDKHGIR